MTSITNEQIYAEFEHLKREVQQLHRALNQVRLAQTAHPYIVKIEGVQGGEPITRDGYVTVRTIVEQTRLGATPEQLVQGYPPLTLAEVHDALSYYYDHSAEIDQLMREQQDALHRATDLSAQMASTRGTRA